MFRTKTLVPVAFAAAVAFFAVRSLPAEPDADEAIPKEVLDYLPEVTSSASLPAPNLPRPVDVYVAAATAWNSFIGLNAKADLGGPRGTSSNQVGQSGEVLVWQTWAHKVELRPNGPLTTPWDQLGTPNYANLGYQIPISEGVTDRGSSASWTLWNNLDEDNEIGSCNVNTPHRTQNPLDQDLVLYQVKVNKDEYEYLRTNYGREQHLPTGKLARAQQQVVEYINDPGNPQHAYYQGAPTGTAATCDCPADKAICLPCGGYDYSTSPGTSNPYPEGAIETKTAWRRLHPGEDSSDFYTTEAIYYTYDEDSDSYRYNNGTFALIGMHIIRKLVNYPDFFFATFEHNSVENGRYEYYTIDGNGAVSGNTTVAQRQTGNNYDPQTNHQVLSGIYRTNQVFHRIYSHSVWKNYQLTGVQSQSLDCNPAIPQKAANCRDAQNTATCIALDPQQNYYMANLVIESDPFLNNFSGPGFGGNPFGDCRNTVYAGRTYNNGGCKGCHGVAQTAFGTDFSFLLDFGEGKPALKPDTIHYRHPVGDFQGPLSNILIGARPSELIKHTTFDTCATTCASGADCTSFGFFPHTRDCALYTATPGNYIRHPVGVAYIRDGFPITGLPALPTAPATATTLDSPSCQNCHGGTQPLASAAGHSKLRLMSSHE